MASSFIDFKGNGFWAKDGFVEAFQLLLFEEITVQFNFKVDWLNGYQKELALQSLPLIYGGMSMCFDEYLTDQGRIEIIASLIDKIKSKISAEKKYLTGTHLNSLRRTVREFLVEKKEFDWDRNEIEKQIKDGEYGEELPVNNYLRGFELLHKLIIGQISFKASTPITYWND